MNVMVRYSCCFSTSTKSVNGAFDYGEHKLDLPAYIAFTARSVQTAVYVRWISEPIDPLPQ